MQFIAFFVPIFFTVFIGGGYAYKQMQESNLSQESTVVEDVPPKVQIVEPTDPNLVPLNDPQPEIESVTWEEAMPSAPSPQPVAAKAQPKEEKKKKDADNESKSHTDEMIKEFKEDMRRMEKEEEERDEYYAKLAEQRKLDIANAAKLAEEKKKVSEAEAAEKKRAQCRKDLQECMDDIGGKILGLSGSAYRAGAIAGSNSCHRKYSCN